VLNTLNNKVMEVTVRCAEPLEVGETPKGYLRVIPIIGGTFEGPRLKGKVIPGGADWNMTREDGVAEVFAKYTIETDDGVLISVTNEGTIKPNGERIITKPTFLVAIGKYDWLNDEIFIGTLDPLPTSEGIVVKLSFYHGGAVLE
jgi:hypothetical protein